MDRRTSGYWVATAAICLILALGGVADLLLPEPVRAIFAELGYPAYFGRILGVWKLLAVVALLVPGFALVKEWAYAGIVFDLTGASASHVASASSTKDVIMPLVMLGVLVASYHLRPPSRRLAGARVLG